eukprot:m51a1_g9926 putative proclotting enzyme (686) ;mRNA; f:6928-9753
MSAARATAALVLAASAAALGHRGTRGSTPAPRVVNGEPVASASQYPWMSSMMWSPSSVGPDYTSCGATLVAPTWALTAGHCVDPGSAELSHWFPPGHALVAGSLAPTDGAPPGSAKALQALTHPRLDVVTMQNDVALIKLDRPVALERYVALAPADYPDLQAGSKVWVLGWGTLYYSGTNRAELMAAKVPVVAREACRGVYRDYVTGVFDSTICIGYNEGGRDTCQGDSGGPLLHVDASGSVVQVGITSWATGCAWNGYPGVYTRVSSYRAWIDETMAAVDRGDRVCGCPTAHIGNGHCNMLCYSEECGWDGGDCARLNCSGGCDAAKLANNVCDVECATEECAIDNYACSNLCADRCLASMVNDGVCQPSCMAAANCNYDGSDCAKQFCDPKCPPALVGNGECNPECYNGKCGHDGGDCAQYTNSCALNCDKSALGDGVCNAECNVAACNYDGGDCKGRQQCNAPSSSLGNGKCSPQYNTSECAHDGGDCLFCSPRCSASMANNSVCDSACHNAQCGWDGGMCDKLAGRDFCSVNCRLSQRGNGVCEEACFNEACGWDAGDCADDVCKTIAGHCLRRWSGDGYCQPACAQPDCGFEGGDCFDVAKESQCAPGCYPVVHRGNGVCEPECLNAACGYDAPDCQRLFGCAPYCVDRWIGDGQCDTECDVANCSWDGGDCDARSSGRD